jgi:metal-sulfur cluster biosynthetic enzyme
MSKVTVEKVRGCLKTVMDPELNVSIVDLGLIYKIQLKTQKSKFKSTGKKSKAAKIRILMTLTTPGCPLAGSFDVLVREALAGLPGIDINRDVKIELTFDPPWTMEMMSDEVKAELQMDGYL